MKASEQSRFDRQYRQHLTALKLQGKADATIDSYARAVRRIAEHFKRSPDSLSAEEFKTEACERRTTDRDRTLRRIIEAIEQAAE